MEMKLRHLGFAVTYIKHWEAERIYSSNLTLWCHTARWDTDDGEATELNWGHPQTNTGFLHCCGVASCKALSWLFNKKSEEIITNFKLRILQQESEGK